MPKVQRKSFAVRMKQGVKKARRKQIRRLQNTVQDGTTDDHNDEIVNPDEAGRQVLVEEGTSQMVQDNRAPRSQSPPPPNEEAIRQGLDVVVDDIKVIRGSWWQPLYGSTWFDGQLSHYSGSL
ncbi:2289_t:CDS:2 [Rhizophagus irregularis]|nr:2289_t:CDS:2 [Rhizophagus irregularis]